MRKSSAEMSTKGAKATFQVRNTILHLSSCFLQGSFQLQRAQSQYCSRLHLQCIDLMPFTCHQFMSTIGKVLAHTVAGSMYLEHTFEGFASFPISRMPKEQNWVWVLLLSPLHTNDEMSHP